MTNARIFTNPATKILNGVALTLFIDVRNLSTLEFDVKSGRSSSILLWQFDDFRDSSIGLRPWPRMFSAKIFWCVPQIR